MPKENKGIDIICSTLSPKNFDKMLTHCHVDVSFRARLPEKNQTITTPPPGYVGVYMYFMKSGLRFPVFNFLRVVLKYYRLHIAQIAPNGFCKIIAFVMLSRAFGIEPSIKLFRHFYVVMSSGDWVSFSLRHGLGDIIDDLPSSVKRWKPEFFFVTAAAFDKDMQFGDTQSRESDPPPKLTDFEKKLVKKMPRHPVKWAEPDEVLLGMADLSPAWKNAKKRPLLRVGDQVISLLDQLSRKSFEGTIEVTEGPLVPFSAPAEALTTAGASGSTEPIVLSESETLPDPKMTEGTAEADSRATSDISQTVVEDSSLKKVDKDRVSDNKSLGKRVAGTDDAVIP